MNCTGLRKGTLWGRSPGQQSPELPFGAIASAATMMQTHPQTPPGLPRNLALSSWSWCLHSRASPSTPISEPPLLKTACCSVPGPRHACGPRRSSPLCCPTVDSAPSSTLSVAAATSGSPALQKSPNSIWPHPSRASRRSGNPDASRHSVRCACLGDLEPPTDASARPHAGSRPGGAGWLGPCRDEAVRRNAGPRTCPREHPARKSCGLS
mmetsp:Transcript_85823/g.277043  ORF Transcript_85823/g.277043 Transcript_85823/m.277043 type:complete len:210 (-) Transcript_85823:137-766(-)